MVLDLSPTCRPSAPARVLLAEPNERLGAVLAACLRRELGRVRVESVACGAAAWRALQGGERVDVLVTEVMLPGLDGLTLLQQVRARGPGAPRVLVVTGVSPARLRPHRAALEGVPVFHKPLSPEALVHAVRVALAPSASRLAEVA